MSITIKEIQGWKWEDLETAQVKQSSAKEHFGLPKDGMLTSEAYELQENKNSRGEVLFYYTPYSYPSQLVEILGDPETFDINIEIPD